MEDTSLQQVLVKMRHDASLLHLSRLDLLIVYAMDLQIDEVKRSPELLDPQPSARPQSEHYPWSLVPLRDMSLRQYALFMGVTFGWMFSCDKRIRVNFTSEQFQAFLEALDSQSRLLDKERDATAEEILACRRGYLEWLHTHVTPLREHALAIWSEWNGDNYEELDRLVQTSVEQGTRVLSEQLALLAGYFSQRTSDCAEELKKARRQSTVDVLSCADRDLFCKLQQFYSVSAFALYAGGIILWHEHVYYDRIASVQSKTEESQDNKENTKLRIVLVDSE